MAFVVSTMSACSMAFSIPEHCPASHNQPAPSTPPARCNRDHDLTSARFSAKVFGKQRHIFPARSGGRKIGKMLRR
jgi:hypothetical protein